MEIVHVLYAFKYGGIETMLVNIANRQTKHGNVSIIIINDLYDTQLLESLNPNIHVIHIHRKVGSKNIFDLIKLNQILLRLKPHVIHIHMASIIKYLIPNLRSRVILTMHTTPSMKHNPYLRKINTIVSISNSVKEDLRQLGHKSILIENGIIVDDFIHKTVEQEVDVFRIVQVGRIKFDTKGQDLLLSAVKILVDSGANDIKLDYIGDGEDRLKLESLIKEYKLTDCCQVLGTKNQSFLQNHLKDYSLFVLPSYIEGFGLTIVEAMAAKVPVLVSNLEGPLGIINGGDFGFFFHKGDTAELSEKIREIKANNSLTEFCNKAYHRVKTLYDIERTVNGYNKLYNQKKC